MVLPNEDNQEAAPRHPGAQPVPVAPGDLFVWVFSSQAYLNRKEYFGDNVPIRDLAQGGL